MPRGVKGSGKKKAIPVSNQNGESANAPAENTERKARKAYPTPEERIAMADRQITRLTNLNASREVLIKKTEGILEKRQKALAKSAAQLERAQAKKARLLNAQSAKPAKKSAEEKAAEKAAKKEEQEKYEELVSALKESGKSMDDLLAELKEG